MDKARVPVYATLHDHQQHAPGLRDAMIVPRSAQCMATVCIHRSFCRATPAYACTAIETLRAKEATRMHG